jgi:hypothetical protein
MTGQVGRPRTSDPALVPLTLEGRERTGETWRQIARDLGANRGTLRTRCAERVRSVHKTADGHLADAETAPDPSAAPDLPPVSSVQPLPGGQLVGDLPNADPRVCSTSTSSLTIQPSTRSRLLWLWRSWSGPATWR